MTINSKHNGRIIRISNIMKSLLCFHSALSVCISDQVSFVGVVQLVTRSVLKICPISENTPSSEQLYSHETDLIRYFYLVYKDIVRICIFMLGYGKYAHTEPSPRHCHNITYKEFSILHTVTNAGLAFFKHVCIHCTVFKSLAESFSHVYEIEFIIYLVTL